MGVVLIRVIDVIKISIRASRFVFSSLIKSHYSFSTSNIMGDDSSTNASEPVVQYVLIRTDLKSSLKWSYGAVAAQICHASVAAIHVYYSNENTQAYLKDLTNMHKIILQVPDEESIKKINETLKGDNIDFYQWFEKPDNIYTSLALRPYPKSKVEHYFKNLKLYRN